MRPSRGTLAAVSAICLALLVTALPDVGEPIFCSALPFKAWFIVNQHPALAVCVLDASRLHQPAAAVRCDRHPSSSHAMCCCVSFGQPTVCTTASVTSSTTQLCLLAACSYSSHIAAWYDRQ